MSLALDSDSPADQRVHRTIRQGLLSPFHDRCEWPKPEAGRKAAED
jgi:hypothetical protein